MKKTMLIIIICIIYIAMPYCIIKLGLEFNPQVLQLGMLPLIVVTWTIMYFPTLLIAIFCIIDGGFKNKMKCTLIPMYIVVVIVFILAAIYVITVNNTVGGILGICHIILLLMVMNGACVYKDQVRK
jgi:hypothetical protein